MNIIVKKYSESQEYKRDQLRTALNKQFTTDYDIWATYPEDQTIIARNWELNEYYEIPYTLENNQYNFGDPKKTEYDQIFNTEQVLNSMKQGQPLILLNSETENPVYRVLVQTDEELPAQDMGLDKIRYDPEAIKTAVNGLLGEYVYDDTQSNHSRIRNPSTSKKKFAQVVNTGYCPNYGGYTDWEVFDHDYIPLVEQALNSRSKGLPVKEGPSTEIIPAQGKKYDTNSLLLTDFQYNGINWDKNPRDKSTGVCSTVLNSLPDNIKGEPKMTDKIEIPKEEYNALLKAKTDKENLETELETGKGLYAKGKKAYEQLKTEAQDLKEQLIPVWNAQEERKTEIVNSILEKIPEAEREAKKEKFDGMNLDHLEEFVILNSIDVDSGEKGVLDNGGKGNHSKKKISMSDFRNTRRAKRF